MLRGPGRSAVSPLTGQVGEAFVSTVLPRRAATLAILALLARLALTTEPRATALGRR
jgi:hypothetical protein